MENQKVEGGKYYTPEIEEFYVGFEYDTGFFGNCKNISELKRILKQIEYK